MQLVTRLRRLVPGLGPAVELDLVREGDTVGKHADVVYDGETYWSMDVAHSPSGKYLVAYYDREPVFFFADERLRWTRDLGIVNDAAVADDGTAALVDWESRDELGATLYGFDPSGERRLRTGFDANVSSVAISRDGQYVAVATFAPDLTTYVFDATTGEQELAHDIVGGAKAELAFSRTDDGWVLHLADEPGDRALYTIDVDGAVVGKTKAYERELES